MEPREQHVEVVVAGGNLLARQNRLRIALSVLINSSPGVLRFGIGAKWGDGVEEAAQALIREATGLIGVSSSLITRSLEVPRHWKEECTLRVHWDDVGLIGPLKYMRKDGEHFLLGVGMAPLGHVSFARWHHAMPKSKTKANGENEGTGRRRDRIGKEKAESVVSKGLGEGEGGGGEGGRWIGDVVEGVGEKVDPAFDGTWTDEAIASGVPAVRVHDGPTASGVHCSAESFHKAMQRLSWKDIRGEWDVHPHKTLAVGDAFPGVRQDWTMEVEQVRELRPKVGKQRCPLRESATVALKLSDKVLVAANHPFSTSIGNSLLLLVRSARQDLPARLWHGVGDNGAIIGSSYSSIDADSLETYETQLQESISKALVHSLSSLCPPCPLSVGHGDSDDTSLIGAAIRLFRVHASPAEWIHDGQKVFVRKIEGTREAVEKRVAKELKNCSGRAAHIVQVKRASRWAYSALGGIKVQTGVIAPEDAIPEGDIDQWEEVVIPESVEVVDETVCHCAAILCAGQNPCDDEHIRALRNDLRTIRGRGAEEEEKEEEDGDSVEEDEEEEERWTGDSFVWVPATRYVVSVQVRPPKYLEHAFFGIENGTSKPKWHAAVAPVPALVKDPTENLDAPIESVVPSVPIAIINEDISKHKYSLDHWGLVFAVQDPERSIVGLSNTSAIRVVLTASTSHRAALSRASLNTSEVDLVIDLTHHTEDIHSASEQLVTFLNNLHPLRPIFSIVELAAVPLLAASLQRMNFVQQNRIDIVLALCRSDLFPIVHPKKEKPLLTVKQRVLRASSLLTKHAPRRVQLDVADVVVLDTKPTVVVCNPSSPPSVGPTSYQEREGGSRAETSPAIPSSPPCFGARVLPPSSLLAEDALLEEAHIWMQSFGRIAPSFELVERRFVVERGQVGVVVDGVEKLRARRVLPHGLKHVGLVSVVKHNPGVGATCIMRCAALKLCHQVGFVVLWLKKLPSQREQSTFLKWVNGYARGLPKAIHVVLFLDRSSHGGEQESDVLPHSTTEHEILDFIAFLDDEIHCACSVVATWDKCSSEVVRLRERGGLRRIIEKVYAMTPPEAVVELNGLLDSDDEIRRVAHSFRHLAKADPKRPTADARPLGHLPSPILGTWRSRVGAWTCEWPSPEDANAALDQAVEAGVRSGKQSSYSTPTESPRHILTLALAASRGKYAPAARFVQQRCSLLKTVTPIRAMYVAICLIGNFAHHVPGLKREDVVAFINEEHSKVEEEHGDVSGALDKFEKAEFAFWELTTNVLSGDKEQYIATIHPFIGSLSLHKLLPWSAGEGDSALPSLPLHFKGTPSCVRSEYVTIARVAQVLDDVGRQITRIRTDYAARDMFVHRHHLCLWPKEDLFTSFILPFSPILSLFTDARDLKSNMFKEEGEVEGLSVMGSREEILKTLPKVLRDRSHQLLFVLGSDDRSLSMPGLPYRILTLSRALSWWGTRTASVQAMNVAFELAKRQDDEGNGNHIFKAWRNVCQYKRGVVRGGDRGDHDKEIGKRGLVQLLHKAIENSREEAWILVDCLRTVCKVDALKLLTEVERADLERIPTTTSTNGDKDHFSLISLSDGDDHMDREDTGAAGAAGGGGEMG